MEIWRKEKRTKSIRGKAWDVCPVIVQGVNKPSVLWIIADYWLDKWIDEKWMRGSPEMQNNIFELKVFS